MKRTAGIVGLLVAAVVMGYLIRIGQENMTHSQQKALEKAVALANAQLLYDNLEKLGNTYSALANSPAFPLLGMRNDVQALLSERISANLALPWDPAADMDTRWGTAYWVKHQCSYLNNVVFSETMSDQKQDEMIRMLCYQIEFTCLHPSAGNGANLFAILNEYPRVTVPQHAPMLARAVHKAARSRDCDMWRGAFGFIRSQLTQDWAAAECWSLIDRTSRWDQEFYNTDYLTELLWSLEAQSLPRTHGPRGREIHDAKHVAAAQAILDRFIHTDWNRAANVRPVTIREWSRLKKQARPHSAPTTSQVN